MMAVDPVGDGRVVPVRDQDGQGEAAQQPLGGPLPVRFLVADLDQLAGEREVVLADPQLGAQALAQGEVPGRDVALAGPQAEQFPVDVPGLLVEIPLGDGGVSKGVLAVGERLLRQAGRRGDLASAVGEVLAGRDRIQARLPQQVAEGQSARTPGVPDGPAVADLPLDVGELVAAVPCALDLQVGLLLPQSLEQRGQRALLGGELVALLAQAGERGVQETGLDVGKVVRQRVAPGGEGPQFLVHGVVGVEFLQQRAKQRELGLGPLDGLVGLGEVIEVGDDVGDGPGSVEGFEHVLAYEVGQVADRLHRHGLVEQLHGLLGLDSEAAAEVPAVLGEPVVEPDPWQRPQLTPQCVHVGAEPGEVTAD